jgi:hypothetical protein
LQAAVIIKKKLKLNFSILGEIGEIEDLGEINIIRN